MNDRSRGASAEVMQARLSMVRRALLTWPDRAAWRAVAAELAWGVPMVALFAWVGGLVRYDPVADWGSIAVTVAMLFLIPALGEEILFRGALLDPVRSGTGQVAIATALFVLWHPLQAITIGPAWSAMFLDPWFLAAVAALGTMLSRVYLRTASLWPCVLIHWTVVAAWKAVFGGPF